MTYHKDARASKRMEADALPAVEERIRTGIDSRVEFTFQREDSLVLCEDGDSSSAENADEEAVCL